MENPLNQFIQSAREVRLSDKAAARIRERLTAHMRAYVASPGPITSPYQRFFGTPTPWTALLKRPTAALSLILIVMVGGMTASAASDALPGDTLYPLKVNVMEPVKGLFAISPKERATWQASLTDARLSEVEQLAVKKEFTPEEGVASKERFDSSLSAAQDTLQKLSQKDPDAAAQISASFTASLDEHEKILTVLGNATTTQSAAEVDSFAKHVRSKIKKSIQDEERTEEHADPRGDESSATSSTPLGELGL